jgi:DNA-directed RNA polymerase specialized sigma24 family protein
MEVARDLTEDLRVASERERRQQFAALYHAHRVDIAAYCRWRTSTPSDAEDAVAEVFLVAWRRLDDIPVGDATRAWLYATARRVMANQRRSGARLERLRERIAGEASTWPLAPTMGPGAGAVHDALARLTELDREVLLLAEWEGLTTDEIARALDCLPVTARGRLHRARRRFRIAFEAIAAEDVHREKRAPPPQEPIPTRPPVPRIEGVHR